jgi:uncharacterized protein YcsI (UPF0317 family)
MMTCGEIMEMLQTEANKVKLADLERNKHLCDPPDGMTQGHIQAALAGLLNQFAFSRCGMDYAVSAREICE